MSIYFNLFFIFFILILAVVTKQAEGERSARVKRKIIFPPRSKLFLRMAIKEDLDSNRPWAAFVIGFKIFWELPTTVKQFPIRRRSVYEDVENLFDKSGLNGRECIFHYMCEATKSVFAKSTLMEKALKVIFTIPEEERQLLHPYNATSYCETTTNKCPIRLENLIEFEQHNTGSVGLF